MTMLSPCRPFAIAMASSSYHYTTRMRHAPRMLVAFHADRPTRFHRGGEGGGGGLEPNVIVVLPATTPQLSPPGPRSRRREIVPFVRWKHRRDGAYDATGGGRTALRCRHGYREAVEERRGCRPSGRGGGRGRTTRRRQRATRGRRWAIDGGRITRIAWRSYELGITRVIVSATKTNGKASMGNSVTTVSPPAPAPAPFRKHTSSRTSTPPIPSPSSKNEKKFAAC